MKLASRVPLWGFLIAFSSHASGAVISDCLSILDRSTNPATAVPLLTIGETTDPGTEAPISYTSAVSVAVGGAGIAPNRFTCSMRAGWLAMWFNSLALWIRPVRSFSVGFSRSRCSRTIAAQRVRHRARNSRNVDSR